MVVIYHAIMEYYSEISAEKLKINKPQCDCSSTGTQCFTVVKQYSLHSLKQGRLKQEREVAYDIGE